MQAIELAGSAASVPSTTCLSAQRRIRVLMSHMAHTPSPGPSATLCHERASAAGSVDHADEHASEEYYSRLYWNVVALVILSQLSSLHRPMLQTQTTHGPPIPTVRQLQQTSYNRGVHSVAQWLGYFYSSVDTVMGTSRKNTAIVGSALIPLGLLALTLVNHRTVVVRGHDGDDDDDHDDDDDDDSDRRGRMQGVQALGNLLCSAALGVGSGIAQRTAFSSIIMDQFPQESRQQSFAISMYLLLTSVVPLWAHPVHSWLSTRLARMAFATDGDERLAGALASGIMSSAIAVLVIPLLYRSMVDMSELYNERAGSSVDQRDRAVADSRRSDRSTPAASSGTSQQTGGIPRRRRFVARVVSMLDSMQYIAVLLTLSMVPAMTNSLSPSMLQMDRPRNTKDRHRRILKEGVFHGIGQALPALYRLLGIGFDVKRHATPSVRRDVSQSKQWSFAAILNRLVGPKVWRHARLSVDNLVGYTLFVQLMALLGLSYSVHSDNSDSNDQKREPGIVQSHMEPNSRSMDRMVRRAAAWTCTMLLYMSNAMTTSIVHRYHKEHPGIASPTLQSVVMCLGNTVLPSLWNMLIPSLDTVDKGDRSQLRTYHKFMLYIMTIVGSSSYLLARLNYHFKRRVRPRKMQK